MKKLLLILLLTILPIQYSWSMAAVYCQHEPAKVSHFGHHGHHHQAQADDGADHQGKPGKAHSDCGVCHHAMQASVTASDGVAVVAETRWFAAPPLFSYLSHISDGPSRPDWVLVA